MGGGRSFGTHWQLHFRRVICIVGTFVAHLVTCTLAMFLENLIALQANLKGAVRQNIPASLTVATMAAFPPPPAFLPKHNLWLRQDNRNTGNMWFTFLEMCLSVKGLSKKSSYARSISLWRLPSLGHPKQGCSYP